MKNYSLYPVVVSVLEVVIVQIIPNVKENFVQIQNLITYCIAIVCAKVGLSSYYVEK